MYVCYMKIINFFQFSFVQWQSHVLITFCNDFMPKTTNFYDLIYFAMFLLSSNFPDQVTLISWILTLAAAH